MSIESQFGIAPVKLAEGIYLNFRMEKLSNKTPEVFGWLSKSNVGGRTGVSDPILVTDNLEGKEIDFRRAVYHLVVAQLRTIPLKDTDIVKVDGPHFNQQGVITLTMKPGISADKAREDMCEFINRRAVVLLRPIEKAIEEKRAEIFGASEPAPMRHNVTVANLPLVIEASGHNKVIIDREKVSPGEPNSGDQIKVLATLAKHLTIPLQAKDSQTVVMYYPVDVPYIEVTSKVASAAYKNFAATNFATIVAQVLQVKPAVEDELQVKPLPGIIEPDRLTQAFEMAKGLNIKLADDKLPALAALIYNFSVSNPPPARTEANPELPRGAKVSRVKMPAPAAETSGTLDSPLFAAADPLALEFMTSNSMAVDPAVKNILMAAMVRFSTEFNSRGRAGR